MKDRQPKEETELGVYRLKLRAKVQEQLTMLSRFFKKNPPGLLKKLAQ